VFTEQLHDNGVLELVIDRPPVNAFSIGLINELAARLERVKDEPAVRAVVLRGAGPGFCGGGDVKEVEKLAGFEGILGHGAGSLRLCLAMLNCPAPVIGAVHAYCVGIGVLVAGATDLLVAARDTRFVLAEVDNGATAGGVQALKLMPEKRVRAAMMTAEPVLAQELHALGSIYRLAETPGETAAAGLAVAAQVAAKNPEALRRLKASLNNTTRAQELTMLYRAEMSYTYELNIMGVASDGRSAFIDKKRAGYAD
jgi:enoyl-CoA hydratase